jgi:predicted nucleotidyltransferase
MTLEDVRRLVLEDRRSLQKSGVTALYVFGSLARGDVGPESDIDIIVDYDEASNFDLVALAGIKRRLSERLGCSVDVVTRGGLHRRIRDRVLEQAVRVL